MFVDTDALTLFLLMIPGILLLLIFERRKRIALLRLGLNLSPMKWTIWGIVSFGIIVALLILAIARPFNGYEDRELSLPGQDVVFLVDISKSMLASDLQPSRLEVAKQKLLDYLSITEAKGRADRISIIVFSGRAFVYCPFTLDYPTIRLFIEELSPELSTSLGTNINNAISVAAKSLKRIESSSPHLILLSDGEDPGFLFEEALGILTRSRLYLDVLGIGTKDGVSIKLSEDHYVTDSGGNVVFSRLNEDFLKSLAIKSGGKYILATLDASDISSLINDESLPTTIGLRKIRVYEELGPLLVLFALCLSIILFHFQRRFLAVIFLLSFAFQIASAETFNDVSKMTPHDAYLAYEAHDYEMALKAFQYFSIKDPDNRKVSRALASTLFKLGKVRESVSLFSRLAESSQSGREKFALLYDLGNAFFALGDFPLAIDAYERALAIKKDDSNTRFNRDLALIYLHARQQKSAPQVSGGENINAFPISPADLTLPEEPPVDFEEEQPGTDNVNDTPFEGKRSHQKESQREAELINDRVRLKPADNEYHNEEKRKAENYLDSLPDSPVLSEKDKQISAEHEAQWW